MADASSVDVREAQIKTAGLRLKVENPKLGLNMSVIPNPNHPLDSIEVAFIDRRSGRFVETLLFGGDELQADISDPDFWAEFDGRYGNRFKGLTTINREKLEEAVFPDIVEYREKGEAK